jgi:peptidoglycan/LPS O-acetylase OafA/YrhL
MPVLAESPKIFGRSNGLDALRAVLAMWVVTAHLFPWVDYLQGEGSAPRAVLMATSMVAAITQSTWELNPAVVVFIVLSGYCIHRAGFRDDRRDVRAYLVRRVARILPIFYVALFAGIAIGAFETQAPSIGCVAAQATAISALTSIFWTCQLGNAPLATVTVEILLYGLYAIAFWLLAWRGKELWIWIACGLIGSLGMVVAARARSDYGFYSWWQNSSLLSFIPFWWIGAAFVNPRISKVASRWLPFLAVTYVIATAYILTMKPELRLEASNPSDVPTLAFIVAELRKFVLAILAGALIVRLESIKIGVWNPLSILGRAGYSLYALHTPITFVLLKDGYTWPLVISANIATALASYFVIERTGIRAGKSYLTHIHAQSFQPKSDQSFGDASTSTFCVARAAVSIPKSGGAPAGEVAS